MCGAENSGLNLSIARNQLWFTLLILALGWMGYWIFRDYFPERYFILYPLIPLFFFLFGFNFIRFFVRKSIKGSKELLKIYLMAKGIKFIASLAIIGIYFLVDGSQRISFIVTFLIFYLICLSYESGFFYFYEKNRNKNKIQ